jgi:hypothetical protein
MRSNGDQPVHVHVQPTQVFQYWIKQSAPPFHSVWGSPERASARSNASAERGSDAAAKTKIVATRTPQKNETRAR